MDLPTNLPDAVAAQRFFPALWDHAAHRDRGTPATGPREQMVTTYLGHPGLTGTRLERRHRIGAFVPFTPLPGLPGGYLLAEPLPPVLVRGPAPGKTDLAGEGTASEWGDPLHTDDVLGAQIDERAPLPASRRRVGLLDLLSDEPTASTPSGTHALTAAVLAAREVADALDESADREAMGRARAFRREATAYRAYADRVEPHIGPSSRPWLADLADLLPDDEPERSTAPVLIPVTIRAAIGPANL